MGWAAIPGGTKGFDHDVTGWKLEGKHSAVDCADCHKKKNRQGLRTYLGQDRLCGTCHKNDQPHGFERREMLACERCHGQSIWNPPKSDQDFDHNDKRDAMMPLVGSHEDVSCEKCHPKALFNLKGNNPDFCGNCHDSPHDGMLFGKKECEWCHSPAFGALDKFKFDHDKKTSFALGRAHGKMTCDAVPHPGARRAQARQDLRGRRLPRRTTTSTAIASARSAAIRRAARPATCRRRVDLGRDQLQPRQEDQVQADRRTTR
jgi:hypothetical protein